MVKLFLLLFLISKTVYAEEFIYVLHTTVPGFSQNYISNLKSGYSTIIVTGLTLRKNGKLVIPNKYITYIQKISGTKQTIYPMVVFRSAKEGRELLKSSEYRKKAVQEILNFLHTNSFKGIHLDFEYLEKKDKYDLEEFLKELKNSKQNQNYHISMAVFPPLFFKQKWSDFHDPSILKKYTDFIVLMSYDYHNPKTKPGCVTSIDYTEKNIKHLLKYFPSNKIWLGLPYYGYKYNKKSGKVSAISYKTILSYSQKKSTIKRDASGCIIIEDKGSIGYYPDTKLLNVIKKQSNKMNLGSIGFWRAGFDN